MLDIRSLSVSYGKHVALSDANIEVGKGEIVVILGANGAGKSSLLKAISGISEGKVTGSVSMQGNELVDLSADKIVEAGIALVPEGRGVFPDLTVHENLKLGSHSQRARDDVELNLSRVLSLFPKLKERSRQNVRTMSGGEQQMVAVGRAMMSNPAILTLDEPSLGLSPLLCKDLFQSLKAVRDTGIGILLVEQNAKQSLAIADRGYLIENGSIVHQAPAEELIKDPAVQAAYLGGASASGHGTAKAAPPRPQTPATPTLTAPSPPPARPAGSSPSDIAAAAMQAFSQPRTSVPEPQAPAPPAQVTPPVPPSPQPIAPAAAPKTPMAPSKPGTIDIDALVARARDTSAASVSARDTQAPPRKLNGAEPKRLNGSAAHRSAAPSLPETKMPDLSASHDRLKAALDEIEQAAARARAYRPNRNP